MSRTSALASFVLLVLASAALIGCPSPETPYAFAASSDQASTADTAARTLAAEGYEVGHVNHETGIVTSKWTTRGDATANGVFVSRMTVIVAPAGSGSQVTVRMDVKSCPNGGYDANDNKVSSACRAIDGVFPGDQAKIDALGAKLRAATSH